MSRRKGEQVRVVYVTESHVKAMKQQLEIAAKEYESARASKEIAQDELALRRATFLDCIERLKTVVIEGRP